MLGGVRWWLVKTGSSRATALGRKIMANPNPSPETRFKLGHSGGGKTAEQKRHEYEAAEMAAKLRHAMLSGIMEKVDAGATAEDLLTSDVLRLMKDSEDRAHGTPKASTLLGSDPDNPMPTSIAVHIVKPDGAA